MVKGDIYKVKGEEKFFQMVGYFGGDLVFAPMNKDEDQVLIYNRDEVKDFISSGYFSKLHLAKKK